MNKEMIWGLVVAFTVGVFVGYFIEKQRAITKMEEAKMMWQQAKQVATKTINVQFANHIQAKLPEQDVFIESKNNPNQVVRLEKDVAKDQSLLAKTVFAAASATAHDPFKLGQNPLGPFQKGKSLGITLGDWLAATGKGTYVVEGDNAKIDFSFQKLVPNATYTVWCSRLTFPPNANVVDKPCGNPDGSENIFKTDENGNGSFALTLKPVEESTKETASIFAIAYHSDGKTYGANPGDFGLNSHVQLFFLVPVPEAK